MRDLGLLAARAVVGGYVAAHGAQKLFGVLGGGGIEGTAKMFDSIGLRPGKEMAVLAGAAEFGGGVLTATGVASPLGPVAISGAMSVATAVHRKAGPFAREGGYELPLTNLAVATALALAGPGRLRLGPKLSFKLTTLTLLGAGALTGVALQKLLNHRPELAPGDVDVESAVATTEA
jgi:putative oxidoreductase